MEFSKGTPSHRFYSALHLLHSPRSLSAVDNTIQDMEQEGSLKYLGINEGDGIEHVRIKEKIRKEYYRHIRLVPKSELNAVNMIDVINTLAVPVVTYSFTIINWKMEDLKKVDRKTRKLLHDNAENARPQSRRR